MPQERESKHGNPYRFRGGAEASSVSSLTVENPAEGHQYKAYQVFKGTVSSDGTKLSNVQYGANYAGREGMTLDEELAQLEAEGADAKVFAEAVRNLLTGDPAAVLTKENPAAEMEAGYYIIIDESLYEGSGDSLSDYIVAVAGNVTIQPKSTGVPGFNKSIDEGEDEPQETHTISVEDTEPGHSCEIYQIFTGTAGESGELADLKYGANYGTEGNPVSEDVASSIGTQAFADQVKREVSGTPVAVLTSESPSVDAAAGYYLAVDKDEEGNESGSEFAAVSGDKVVSFNHTAQSVDLSPETADIDWNYTLHEDTGVITLNYYTGTKTDVKVYSHYKVPGDNRVWKAELKSNTSIYNPDNPNKPYMFSEKENIKSVTFSDMLDTSTCKGMAFMFYGCSGMKSIDFGTNFNTAEVTDMAFMFCGCEVLEFVNLSCFDTKNVTNMHEMFSRCKLLTSIDVSCFDTSNVADMSNMFCGCKSLPSIDVSRFDTSNVINMSSMFQECTLLTDLDLSGFNTSKIKYMGAMFFKCINLTNLDVSGFDTENVITMSSMFGECIKLPYLNLSSFVTPNATYMDCMFQECTSLANLDLSELDTSNAKNMNCMFWKCQSLTSLNLSNFDTSNVVDMNSMFAFCNALKVIYATEGKWITSQADTNFMFEGCGTYSVTYVTSTASAGILPEAYASGMDTEQDGTAASSDAIEIEYDDTSVNYSIGDSIPYKLTATMPESITAYKKYKLVFHDKLSAGLDYNRNSLKVFAGCTEIPAENYAVVYSEDGKSLTVSIDDAKAAPWNAVPGTEISVKYSAVLNENAEVKNRNEAWLEYSNDPRGDGTGETGPGVPDTVDVYTFEIRFDKVDKNGDPLAGAGFTLYKKDEAGVFQPFGEEVKGVTRFSFKGLAAGEYKLVETTTPDGYNTMEDFVFRIVSETADGTDGKIKRITMVPVSGGAGAWTAVAADMAFESDIANYTGNTLPSTGGMGTYAFYLAGAAVVITVGTGIAAKKKKGIKSNSCFIYRKKRSMIHMLLFFINVKNSTEFRL